MLWQELLRRGHIVVHGKAYELDHLLSKVVEITIPTSGAFPERKISMLVEYLSHCVSFGPQSEDEPLDFEMLGQSRRMIDHHRAERAFCFDRYRWSKHLPESIAALNNEKCFFTPHKNWVIVKGLDDLGNRVDYEIYFRLRKGETKGTLRMVVESAYVRDRNRASPGKPRKRRDIVSFKVLASKIVDGKEVRNPSRA
jgi:hypothetical protein